MRSNNIERLIIMTLCLGLVTNTFSQTINPSSSFEKKVDSIISNDSFYPTVDRLPIDFNNFNTETIYYSKTGYKITSNFKNKYVFILKLRDNSTFISETYYLPYNWTRIDFQIGYYSITNDTLHLTFDSLRNEINGKAYISQSTPISWTMPTLPLFLLVDKKKLLNPRLEKYSHKPFVILRRDNRKSN